MTAPSSYRAELGIPADAVVALYSGNMGGKQGLEIMAEAGLHFVFCGKGAGKAWVAGRGACFFKDEDQCADLLETLWNDDQAIAGMRIASKKRFLDEFTWADILGQYEALLLRWTAAPEGSAPELLSR